MNNIIKNKAKYLSKRRYGGLREAILQRDNNTCQLCLSTENILVHHKDENVKNNVLDNLITLCLFCHQKIHNPPRFDEKKLKKIVELKKQDKSLKEIGKLFGVSRQRIHQILKLIHSPTP